jgi:hypothetical protein
MRVFAIRGRRWAGEVHGVSRPRSAPSRLIGIALVVVMVFASVLLSHAAEWGAIAPGRSTKDAVRERFGPPSRSTPMKVEGYDTMQWVYEADRAPRGVRRLTVDFGLLTSSGYQPDIVRVLTLEPTPEIFTRPTVVAGWGEPARVGKEGDTPLFYYEDGLIVMFDREGWIAEKLIFTPPQPPSK